VEFSFETMSTVKVYQWMLEKSILVKSFNAVYVYYIFELFIPRLPLQKQTNKLWIKVSCIAGQNTSSQQPNISVLHCTPTFLSPHFSGLFNFFWKVVPVVWPIAFQIWISKRSLSPLSPPKRSLKFNEIKRRFFAFSVYYYFLFMINTSCKSTYSIYINI